MTEQIDKISGQTGKGTVQRRQGRLSCTVPTEGWPMLAGTDVERRVRRAAARS
ncbi:hypothetical protein ACU5JM_01500 (plasmid) [Rhodococcus erythropolis]|uniref:hypothetical protein n=1 Tax=Rhodococcus erythropolis TaxID=1833 RepID=UPI00406BBAE8